MPQAIHIGALFAISIAVIGENASFENDLRASQTGKRRKTPAFSRFFCETRPQKSYHNFLPLATTKRDFLLVILQNISR
jgi:hypothetical protein